jgi:hypothetical protein
MNEANNGAAADLSALIPLDTIEYEVKAPGGVQGTGWIITLCDDAHPKAQAYQNERARERLRKERMIEQAQVNGRKYQADERTPDEERERNAKWIVSRIVGWTPVKLPGFGDEPLAFSDETATRVLMHPKMGWLFAQLIDVVTADRSFTPRSDKTSATSPSTTSA